MECVVEAVDLVDFDVVDIAVVSDLPIFHQEVCELGHTWLQTCNSPDII